MRDELIEHEQYIVRNGKDMSEVADWRWDSRLPQANGLPASHTATTASTRPTDRW